MRTRTPAGVALAGVLASCTCATAPAPVVTSVEPARVAAAADTELVIRGSGFVPLVQVDLDAPEASRVDAGFAVELASGSERVVLAAVTLVSDREMRATVRADTAALGTYDVAVLDPRGRAAFLARALEVVSCAPDGAACDDGDACTVEDRCAAGTCAGGTAMACPPPPACHAPGACDPASGACSDPVPLTGTACEDGDPCTGPDLCDAGACRSGPALCTGAPNTPPLACLAVSPAAGLAGSTAFTLDASCSTDAEDPLSALSFRFAFDYGPGWTAWDTQPSSSPAASTTYASPRVHTAAVEVTDSGAPGLPLHPLRAYAYRIAVAAAAEDVVWVTNTLNTGAGSLRDAVTQVNALGAAKVIAFDLPTPATIVLTSPSLSPLTAPGAMIVGRPGVTVDFDRANQRCLVLDGDGQQVIGLRVVRCDGPAIQVAAGRTGIGIAECTLEGPGTDVANAASLGIDVGAPAAVGPRNDVSGFGTGVRVAAGGAGTTVDGNRLHANGCGIALEGAAATVQRNVLDANGGSYLPYRPALDAAAGSGTAVVRFNVLDANRGDGLRAAAVPLDARNNLFTSNGGFGLASAGTTFVALGPNGWFGNVLGTAQGASLGPLDVTADPLYVSPAAADWRLRGASPAVDAGVDVGLDVNGPSRGYFDGAAPDLGASEYPDFRTPPP